MKTSKIMINGIELAAEFETVDGEVFFGAVRVMDMGVPVGPDISGLLANLGVCAGGRFYPIWYGFEHTMEALGAVH